MATRQLTSKRIVNLASDPVSGSAGDMYYNSATGRYRFYNGAVWADVDSGGAPSGSSLTQSDTAPPTPSLGDMWYETTTGRLFTYYDTFWVEMGSGTTGIYAVDTINVYTLSTKTANYSISSTDDVVLVSALSGPLTMTLPTAVGIAGKQIVVKKIDISANQVTLATSSPDTLDGRTSQKMEVQYEAITAVSDGTNWFII